MPVPPLPVVPVPAEPVPPVAAPVPPVAAPVPPVAAPVPPLAAPVPDDDDVPLLVAAPVPLDDDVLDGVEVLDGVLLDAVSLGVEEDALSPVVRAEPPIEAVSGATSSGASWGILSCVALLPPQAVSPPVARSIRAMAVARRRTGGRSLSRRTAP